MGPGVGRLVRPIFVLLAPIINSLSLVPRPPSPARSWPPRPRIRREEGPAARAQVSHTGSSGPERGEETPLSTIPFCSRVCGTWKSRRPSAALAILRTQVLAPVPQLRLEVLGMLRTPPTTDTRNFVAFGAIHFSRRAHRIASHCLRISSHRHLV